MTVNTSNYSISTDKSKLNFNVIYNSMCFGVYSDHNQQVGFARVVTDKATFAYLADVFIAPHY